MILRYIADNMPLFCSAYYNDPGTCFICAWCYGIIKGNNNT